MIVLCKGVGPVLCIGAKDEFVSGAGRFTGLEKAQRFLASSEGWKQTDSEGLQWRGPDGYTATICNAEPSSEMDAAMRRGVHMPSIPHLPEGGGIPVSVAAPV